MRRAAGIGQAASPASRRSATSTRGMAFLVEALVLMAATMACMAIFATLFFRASETARLADERTHAVALAQDCAEAFSSNPEAETATVEADGLVATSETSQETTAAGTLYHDHVVVSDADGEQVFTLDTSRYVSGRTS